MSNVNTSTLKLANRYHIHTTNKALLEAREYNEITAEELEAAKHIKFVINDEDVSLFVQSISSLSAPYPHTNNRYLLRNIVRVAYASEKVRIPRKYSGAYIVQLQDGTTCKLAWKDSDRKPKLYYVD